MNRTELIAAFHHHDDQQEFDQALTCLDQLIEMDGESDSILDYRLFLLMQLKQYTEALATALKLEHGSLRKSPWSCLKIAEVYLGMEQHEDAILWLEKAIAERYFKRYDVLEQAPYDTLQNDPRFIRLMEQAKENIGLNKPVQDFRFKLLTGEEITLSALKGQVVLIDFWSTDCPPCVREIPALKNLYARFKEQGLEIIGVSLDEHPSIAEKYAVENELGWKIGCSGSAFADELVEQFKIEATPSTWLIDRRGILRFYNVKGKALEDATGQLLTEKNLEFRCRGEYCTL